MRKCIQVPEKYTEQVKVRRRRPDGTFDTRVETVERERAVVTYVDVPDEPIEVDDTPYAVKVERLIRERYTVSDELAILRQRDAKPEEFAEYNAFCEECKRVAKDNGVEE